METLITETTLTATKSAYLKNEHVGNLCPLIPPNLTTKIHVNTSNTTINKLEMYLDYLSIQSGGENSPKNCTARYRVAIIVPYRNREENLLIFLRHLHPFLNKQQLEYGIFLVEPMHNLTFNRGLLMNVGFLESLAISNHKWDCFMFHGKKMIFNIIL